MFGTGSMILWRMLVPVYTSPLRTDMGYLVLISTTHSTSITAVCFCHGTDTSSGSGRQLSKMNADTMANFRKSTPPFNPAKLTISATGTGPTGPTTSPPVPSSTAAQAPSPATANTTRKNKASKAAA